MSSWCARVEESAHPELDEEESGEHSHTTPAVLPRLGGAQRNGRSSSGTLSSCHKLQLERLTLDIRKKIKIARSIVQH